MLRLYRVILVALNLLFIRHLLLVREIAAVVVNIVLALVIEPAVIPILLLVLAEL